MSVAPSTDPRQRLAERQIEDAIAAHRGSQNDHAGMLGGDAPDAAGTAAEWISAHRFQHALAALLGNEGDQLSLVRDQQRIEAEDLARAAHGVAHRDRLRSAE